MSCIALTYATLSVAASGDAATDKVAASGENGI
jgi:hypothetical protein